MAKSEFISGLSYLADKLTFGVLVIARDRIIDYANPVAAELLNLTVSEIQGQSCQSVLGCCTPDGKNLCKEHCLCQLREEGLIKTGIVLKQTTKTKEISTEISVGVYPFPAKSGVEQESLLVFDDTANLIKWDDMRGAFLSAVSHELKAPLTTIKGYVDILLRDEEMDSKTARTFLGSIKQSTERLNQMITKLLTASWLEKGELKLHLQTVDLREIWERAILALGHISEQHQIMLKISVGLKIWSDPGFLEQVCINLLENALKYSPPETVITIGSHLNENKCLIWIRDQGIGIPPNALKKIFHQFYRAPQTHPGQAGGSGLGLFIAEKIITAHGGEIWAESKQGQGSTFFFQIPYPDVVDFLETYG